MCSHTHTQPQSQETNHQRMFACLKWPLHRSSVCHMEERCSGQFKHANNRSVLSLTSNNLEQSTVVVCQLIIQDYITHTLILTFDLQLSQRASVYLRHTPTVSLSAEGPVCLQLFLSFLPFSLQNSLLGFFFNQVEGLMTESVALCWLVWSLTNQATSQTVGSSAATITAYLLGGL